MNKNRWIVLLIILLFVTIISASTNYCKREATIKKAEAQLEDYNKINFQLGDTIIALNKSDSDLKDARNERDALKLRVDNFDIEKALTENEGDLYKETLAKTVKHITLLHQIMDINHITYPEFGVDLPLEPSDLLGNN